MYKNKIEAKKRLKKVFKHSKYFYATKKMGLRKWHLKSFQLKVIKNSYRFSIDGVRSVRLTGVDLLVFGECNETKSSGPKLSKKSMRRAVSKLTSKMRHSFSFSVYSLTN